MIDRWGLDTVTYRAVKGSPPRPGVHAVQQWYVLGPGRCCTESCQGVYVLVLPLKRRLVRCPATTREKQPANVNETSGSRVWTRCERGLPEWRNTYRRYVCSPTKYLLTKKVFNRAKQIVPKTFKKYRL